MGQENSSGCSSQATYTCWRSDTCTDHSLGLRFSHARTEPLSVWCSWRISTLIKPLKPSANGQQNSILNAHIYVCIYIYINHFSKQTFFSKTSSALLCIDPFYPDFCEQGERKALPAPEFGRHSMGQHRQQSYACISHLHNCFRQAKMHWRRDPGKTQDLRVDITRQSSSKLCLSKTGTEEQTPLKTILLPPVICELIQTARKRWLPHLSTARRYFRSDTDILIFAASRHRADSKCHWRCHVCSQFSPCSAEAEPPQRLLAAHPSRRIALSQTKV